MRPVTAIPFPFRPLARPLGAAQRAAVAASLRALLRFQIALDGFPPPAALPRATPFVSLYAGGRLRGCFGSDEGRCGGERLCRAFLRALEDQRFGGVAPGERRALVAEASYVRAPVAVSPERVLETIEPGTHGVALGRAGAPAVLFLPDVARDQQLGAHDLLRALARKAGLPEEAWRSCALALFETSRVVVRPGERRERSGAARDRAAAWLGRLVGEDGAVAFAIDPRSGRRAASGPMHHGRAAVVLAALAAHGGHDRALARGRAWLGGTIARALAGRPVAGWPDDPAVVAGTLALAVLAGAAGEGVLATFAAAKTAAIARSPWHAAQVATALGPGAPVALYRACARDLASRPWAPWTATAARARGDAALLARAERALAASLRRAPPHAGGVDATPVPEIALTAAAAEALGPSRSPAARAAAARARAFLERWQLLGEAIPAALDPGLAEGAFPISPVCDTLRCDVTAHALLALLAPSGS
jgi:AMMECR1 domain-containing protein